MTERGEMVCQTADGCDREVTNTDTTICPECKDSTSYQWACVDCDFTSETKMDQCPTCATTPTEPTE